MTRARKESRHLVAIPAFNEAATVAHVIERVRLSLPGFDLLVVNDGSHDRTEEILGAAGVTTATHLCNLGYGRAIQTAVKYAQRFGYESLVTLDADGQHQPEQVLALFEEFQSSTADCLVLDAKTSPVTHEAPDTTFSAASASAATALDAKIDKLSSDTIETIRETVDGQAVEAALGKHAEKFRPIVL